MLYPPKVLFSTQEFSRHRGQRAESSQVVWGQVLWMEILSPGAKHSLWTSFEKGIWRDDFWPHLRLMGVTDISFASQITLHTRSTCPVPGNGQYGLPCLWLTVGFAGEGARWERRKPRYLFWLSPCGVAKGWLCPSTKALAPFRWPTLYIPHYLWVLLIASGLQSWL